MAAVEDIIWSSYKGYEGPAYFGRHKFDYEDVRTLDDLILAVVTATEGGAYDAINMYDGPPILSSGLIQFIEGGQYSVSDMLGYAIERLLPEQEIITAPLQEAMSLVDAQFIQNRKGRWRFYLSGDEVDRTQEQNILMRGGSNGEKGTWREEDKQLARTWAAAVASVWEHPETQKAQRLFTLSLLSEFAFGKSKDVVLAARRKGSDAALAFIAAYLSFAVNNPTRANRHLQIATDTYKGPFFTKDFLIHVLKELTFGPKIGIYPHRYNAIRPKIERYFNVDLPDFESDLASWVREQGFPFLLTVAELQHALLSLGYDLGPKKADGNYGRKTREAVRSFQEAYEVLPATGELDAVTAQRLEQELLARGSDALKSS